VDKIKVVVGEPMPETNIFSDDSFVHIPPPTVSMQKKAQQLASYVDDPKLAKAVHRAILAYLRRNAGCNLSQQSENQRFSCK
jgi:hypothetical protein